MPNNFSSEDEPCNIIKSQNPSSSILQITIFLELVRQLLRQSSRTYLSGDGAGDRGEEGGEEGLQAGDEVGERPQLPVHHGALHAVARSDLAPQSIMNISYQYQAYRQEHYWFFSQRAYCCF